MVSKSLIFIDSYLLTFFDDLDLYSGQVSIDFNVSNWKTDIGETEWFTIDNFKVWNLD